MREIPDLRKYIPPVELPAIEAGTSTYDCRPAIQRAIDELGLYGGRITGMRGFYPVSSINGYCLKLTAPVIFEGEGYFTCIIPMDSVGPDDDTILYKPSPLIDCSQAVIRNLFLGNPNNGLRRGRYGIHLDTTEEGANLGILTIRNVFIADSGKPSIRHVNNGMRNRNGGMYGSKIMDCQLRGGIQLDGSGDSNHIVDNIIAGKALGINATMTPGASQLDIIGNNITAIEGAIRVDGGRHVNIERCNIEQIADGNVNDRAMIRLRSVHMPTVRSCNLGAYSGVDSLVHLSSCDGAVIESNTLLPSAPGQTGVKIDATCQLTSVARNHFGEGLTRRIMDAGMASA